MTTKAQKAASTRKRNAKARKAATLRGIKAKGTTADVPVPIDTVLGIMSRMTTALVAVEKRLSDELGGKPTYFPESEEPLPRRPAAPVPPAPAGSVDMAPLAVLTEELCLRSHNLRRRSGELMVGLFHGGNEVKGEAPQGTAATTSYGPTKDAILAAHANLAHIEDHLERISDYLLTR